MPEDMDCASEDDRVFKTTSLPLVVTRLDTAMKNVHKLKRGRPIKAAYRTSKSARSAPLTAPPLLRRANLDETQHQGSMADLGTTRKSRKGKERESPVTRYGHQMREHHRNSMSPLLPLSQPGVSRINIPQVAASGIEKAWWLDVASPTSSDMRAIGNVSSLLVPCYLLLIIYFAKLLHIHPLTLEDILQQEPREKLELFPRLGYYFIAFRAMQSLKPSDHLKHATLRSTSTDSIYLPEEESIIQEVMVYLVVFREGVCTVCEGHFSNDRYLYYS
jgi:magnesium transporter